MEHICAWIYGPLTVLEAQYVNTVEEFLLEESLCSVKCRMSDHGASAVYLLTLLVAVNIHPHVDSRTLDKIPRGGVVCRQNAGLVSS